MTLIVGSHNFLMRWKPRLIQVIRGLEMTRGRAAKTIGSLLLFLLFLTCTSLLTSCVSSRQALQMEKRVNCAIMKNLQDNDEDLTQIENGTGAVGEAAACPT